MIMIIRMVSDDNSPRCCAPGAKLSAPHESSQVTFSVTLPT